MRRITSLTAALTFLLVVLTSIILYIVPQGRVAYWADWRLCGLSKTDWGNIHINLGFVSLIALGLHIYYNWKPLMAYLKDKARRFKLFTREFNVSPVDLYDIIRETGRSFDFQSLAHISTGFASLCWICSTVARPACSSLRINAFTVSVLSIFPS